MTIYKDNSKYQILTPAGFQKFDGIRRQLKLARIITLSDNTKLEATDNHRILTDSGWKQIKDCVIGQLVLTNENSSETIISIGELKEQYVYDPINVDNGYAYNSDSLISHNCSFLSSSYTLLSPQCISSLVFDKPILEEENGYKEYVPYQKGHIYVLTVDTATGQKKDYSSFTIVDVTVLPYKVVATYANNGIKTMEYPRVIMEYAKKYNFPWILIEINDIGRDISNILYHEFSYPNLLATRMGDKRMGQKLAFGNGANRQLGVRMTTGVKRSGCALMKALIENGNLIVSDYRIIKELSTFIQNGRVYEADSGQHDDHVMTLVIFAWLTLQPSFAEITGTRALSTYTEMIKSANEESTTINEAELNKGLADDQPLPPIFQNYNEDPDMWLLQQICKT